MKNVILLITDTFRYDNLFDRAERPVRTPVLDRFITERATELHGFYAGSFPTVPHRTDVATSRLGWPHFPWQPISRSSRNHIARHLGDVGYATQLICDCPHLFTGRFHHAFTAAFQHRGQEGDKHLLHLNDAIPTVQPQDKLRRTPSFNGHSLADMHRWINRYFNVEEETFTARTAATASRWLEENYRADPFFLWVDFFDPHEPWDPPEYMVRRYDPDYDGVPMIHCNYGPATDYTEAELRNLWAHYAAEAELVDRHLGRVLQKVDDLDLWDDTIVIVTSDHGTSLGEHNRTGKSNICDTDERFWPLYPEVSHVPFLIAGGDVPRGASLDILGQPVDVLPTVEALAGLALSPTEPFEGVNLAPAIRGDGSYPRSLTVTGGYIGLGKSGGVPAQCVTPFVTDGRWGLTPLGPEGGVELYDLSADPLAADNVAEGEAEAVTETLAALATHMRDHNADEALIAAWTSGGAAGSRLDTTAENSLEY